MKNLVLENFGVLEMDNKEMNEIGGGLVSPWAVLAGIGAAYATVYAIGYVAGVGVAYVEKGLKKLN